MKKKIFIFLIIIIVLVVIIIGYRFIKYKDFIGRFYSENGSYYEFDIFSWKKSYDGSDEVECSLWNCNISTGKIYYTKSSKLYLRYDSTGVAIKNFKIEKQADKTYLYIYDEKNTLRETYIKVK